MNHPVKNITDHSIEETQVKELNKYIHAFLKEAVDRNDYQVQEEFLTYPDFYSDRLLVVMAIKEGIPYDVFSSIQKLSPFTLNEWSVFLDLSTKSLNRYRKSNTRFKSIHSEKIIELAEVTKLGLEVFDNIEQFKLWLETPNYSLGKQKPIDLLSDSYGKELVVAEIVRIDEGIFA